MKVSDEFGQLVRDALGTMGPTEAAIATGVSRAYINQMRHGVVPEVETIAKFCIGLDLGAEPFLKAAEKVRKNPAEDGEKLVHLAAIAGELTNAQRMRLLSLFREMKEDKQAADTAA